ncbi:MAG: thioredoxin domain-containing protein [Pseudomonadota bacterium]
MNRLSASLSPYLLQHAEDPVHWWPWGEDALAEARDSGRPILLSIGYSSCHWCHVMAEESFADPTIAALVNKHFVNIKVDREERPDLDKVYQTAHQLLTGRPGGWPLTVFLTSDAQVPFYAGTYFPPMPQRGLPSFRQLLENLVDVTNNNDLQDLVSEVQQKLSRAFDEPEQPLASGPLQEDVVTAILTLHDDSQGGFGHAPKFPQCSMLQTLLRSSSGREAALFSLRRMASGGLFDHLGGGFFRYSTDDTWTIPHFEKMLYDNGPLLEIYCRAWLLSGDLFFERIARHTAAWLLDEMQSPCGAFYTSIDADSDGEEGACYLWERGEVEMRLGDDFQQFASCFSLDQKPNLGDRWHLRLSDQVPPQWLMQTLADPNLLYSRRSLLAFRSQRLQPQRDEKILTSWNALTIRALFTAAQILDETRYCDAADRALDFVLDAHIIDQRLYAISRNETVYQSGFLDDYALLIDALICSLETSWNTHRLQSALLLADRMITEFEDKVQGGFFFTGLTQEQLVSRPKSYADETLPNGIALASLALLKLFELTGRLSYRDVAQHAIRSAQALVQRWPAAHCEMARAADYLASPPATVIIAVVDQHAAEEMQGVAHSPLPDKATVFCVPASAALKQLDKPAVNGQTTAYVCRAGTCSQPVTTARALQKLLESTTSSVP